MALAPPYYKIVPRPMDVSDDMCATCTDAVDMILKMFPPFPIPGFAPNFTGYDDHWRDVDWYEIHQALAQPANHTIYSVYDPFSQPCCSSLLMPRLYCRVSSRRDAV